MSNECITFHKFKVFVGVLSTLKHLNLLEQSNFMVTWETERSMVLNKFNGIELKPQKVYGAIVTVWNAYGIIVVKKKFSIVGAPDDGL